MGWKCNDMAPAVDCYFTDHQLIDPYISSRLPFACMYMYGCWSAGGLGAQNYVVWIISTQLSLLQTTTTQQQAAEFFKWSRIEVQVGWNYFFTYYLYSHANFSHLDSTTQEHNSLHLHIELRNGSNILQGASVPPVWHYLIGKSYNSTADLSNQNIRYHSLIAFPQFKQFVLELSGFQQVELRESGPGAFARLSASGEGSCLSTLHIIRQSPIKLLNSIVVPARSLRGSKLCPNSLDHIYKSKCSCKIPSSCDGLPVPPHFECCSDFLSSLN